MVRFKEKKTRTPKRDKCSVCKKFYPDEVEKIYYYKDEIIINGKKVKILCDKCVDKYWDGIKVELSK